MGDGGEGVLEDVGPVGHRSPPAPRRAEGGAITESGGAPGEGQATSQARHFAHGGGEGGGIRGPTDTPPPRGTEGSRGCPCPLDL